MKRNGYVDVIKFIFAIVIAEFHLGSGIFPGGRVAVEGFFMISGYLMMNSIAKNKYPSDNIGVSTLKFLAGKYKNLFTMLLPSVAIGYVVNCIANEVTAKAFFSRLPLLIFELIPLKTAGFRGVYVLGISWYLSSMFIALAILYPLVKRFKSSGVLIICPLAAVLGYGALSGLYGNLAVGTDMIKNTIISSGVVRGICGCSLGCLIYEINERVKEKRFTRLATVCFTALEISLFACLAYLMNRHPRSAYDYVCVMLIFGMLTIGICGLSYTSRLMNSNVTAFFGTASTLIVLNHFCWLSFLTHVLPSDFGKTNKILLYIALVAVSSLISYICSRGLKLLVNKLSRREASEK